MRNASCYEIARRVEERTSQGYSGIETVLKVHLRIEGFKDAEEIQKCIDSKQVFGLRGEAGFIVFSPKDNAIYDASGSELVVINSGDPSKFIETVKLYLINFREFVPATVCVDYVKSKKLLT